MKARNIALVLMIAVGLYACGGGGSGSMVSSTPPSSSAPPPATPTPPPPASVSFDTVQTLTAAKVEDADPLTFADGTVLAPSSDESSDPIVVDGP